MVETKRAKSAEDLVKLLTRVRSAQRAYSSFSQQQVDRIFKAVALAADKAALFLAEQAVAETGMGSVEDKVVKNKYAAEYIYSQYADAKTVGIVERDEANGAVKIAEPLGVLAAVVPTTNPTSTAIFNVLLALKTRNAIVFSPHPRAKKCTVEALKICNQAAVSAGAPKDVVAWLDVPSVESAKLLMKECDATLATGGPDMVLSAYSSGKPAIGVGPGNAPVVVDSSGDLSSAAACIVHSKSFDNGTVCASEQNCIAVKDVYEKFKRELVHYGAHLVSPGDLDKIRKALALPSKPDSKIGSINSATVGKTACEIGKLSGIDVPASARILVCELAEWDSQDPLVYEKLCPVLTLIKAPSFAKAVEIARESLALGGLGHTADLYVDLRQKNRIEAFSQAVQTCRILINTPSSQGGIGGIYSNSLPPSLTLGCGSWGGNSTWQNVGVENLLNIKTVSIRKEVPLSFSLPKVFQGSSALKEAVHFAGKNHKGKKVAILFDAASRKQAAKVEERFVKDGFKAVEFELKKNPGRTEAIKAAKQVRLSGVDLLAAVGGNRVVSYAKIVRLLASDPKANLTDLSLPVLTSSKRILSFPKNSAHILAVPTSPFCELAYSKGAVFFEGEERGVLLDDSLTCQAVCLDKKLFARADFEDRALDAYYALGNALSSYVSMTATDESEALARKAVRIALGLFAKKRFSRSKEIGLGTLSAESLSNAGGGLFEALSFAVSEVLGVDYKMAGSVILPHVLQLFTAPSVVSKMGTFANYVKPIGKSKLASLSKKLGFKGSDNSSYVESLKNWAETVRVKHHLPTTLADLGITPMVAKRKGREVAVKAFLQAGSFTSPLFPRIENLQRFFAEL